MEIIFLISGALRATAEENFGPRVAPVEELGDGRTGSVGPSVRAAPGKENGRPIAPPVQVAAPWVIPIENWWNHPEPAVTQCSFRTERCHTFHRPNLTMPDAPIPILSRASGMKRK